MNQSNDDGNNRKGETIPEQSGTDQLVPWVEDGVRDLVPAGSMIVRLAQSLTNRGEYSSDYQMAPAYLQFIYEDLDEIRDNVERLRQDLEECKQPGVADIAATLEAIGEASKTTTNYKKRELLRHAAINAFDPEFYEEGLVNRFLKSIENLEYGDVRLLRNIVRKAEGESVVDVSDVNVSGVGGANLEDHHYEQLKDAGMVGSHAAGTCFPTEYGERFLTFVSKPEEEKPSDNGE